MEIWQETPESVTLGAAHHHDGAQSIDVTPSAADESVLRGVETLELGSYDANLCVGQSLVGYGPGGPVCCGPRVIRCCLGLAQQCSKCDHHLARSITV